MEHRRRTQVLATCLLAGAAWGCVGEPPPPRTFTSDPDRASQLAFDPSRCFPEGADTIAVGPEPGCVDALVRGEPFADEDHPLLTATGRPMRVVIDGDPETLDVQIDVAHDCGSGSGEQSTFFTLSSGSCTRGESRNARCDMAGDRWVVNEVSLPHAEVAYDGRTSEHFVAGGFLVRVTACATRR